MSLPPTPSSLADERTTKALSSYVGQNVACGSLSPTTRNPADERTTKALSSYVGHNGAYPRSIQADLGSLKSDTTIEPVVFRAVLQNTTSLFEQAFRILPRLRTAYEQQKDTVEVLIQHESELRSIKTIICIIEDEKVLQINAVAAELIQVRELQTKLKDHLSSLEPREKGRMEQIARQLVQRSADEKKLTMIMDELVQVKARLLLSIQVAQIGVMKNTRKELVANTEVIQRIDEYLREAVSDCKGLRIARLLEGRHPSEDGTVPISAEELRSLAGAESEDSEDETLIDESETFSRNSAVRTEHTVLHNKTRGRAAQINEPVERDTTTDLHQLAIKYNNAEEESLQVNYGVTLTALTTLMDRQEKLLARPQNGRYDEGRRTLVGQDEEVDMQKQSKLHDRENALYADTALVLDDNDSVEARDTSDLMSILPFDTPLSLTPDSTRSNTRELGKTAAEQFAEILIDDDAMQPLFQSAIERTGSLKLKRTLSQLLSNYGVDLRNEASSPIQIEATRLVGPRASFIAYLVVGSMQGGEIPALSQLMLSKPDKKLDLERFLRQIAHQNWHDCIDSSLSTLDTVGYFSEHSRVGELDITALVNLDEVKKFMVESEAYKTLRESIYLFVYPPDNIANTSWPSRVTEGTTITPYRLFWTCVCGHKQYDDFVETIPGSVAKLASMLRANGVRAQLEVRLSHDNLSKIHRLYLLLHNTIVHARKMIATPFRQVLGQTASSKTTTDSTGSSSQTSACNVTEIGLQAARPVNMLPHAQYKSNSASDTDQTTDAQNQHVVEGSQHDYMLLCRDEQGWLTTREDLDVSQIRSDRQLFDTFKLVIRRRNRWPRQFLSLKSIQRISFVKFALCQDQEIAQLQLDQIPPPSETHYEFHERVPGCVPPIGNRFLMHRFSNSACCRDSTHCLSQVPKRVRGRPQYGTAPDGSTAWGLYFQEDLDMVRLYFCGSVASLISLIFGTVWSANRKSIQDGFAVASYILALEVLMISTIQIGTRYDWI